MCPNNCSWIALLYGPRGVARFRLSTLWLPFLNLLLCTIICAKSFLFVCLLRWFCITFNRFPLVGFFLRSLQLCVVFFAPVILFVVMFVLITFTSLALTDFSVFCCCSACSFVFYCIFICICATNRQFLFHLKKSAFFNIYFLLHLYDLIHTSKVYVSVQHNFSLNVFTFTTTTRYSLRKFCCFVGVFFCMFFCLQFYL